MPARGATLRTIGRMTARHFRDTVQVYRFTGVTSSEIEQWSEILGPFMGKLMDRSGMTYSADSAAQAYDATVVVVAGTSFIDPNERYKVTVTQYKTAKEGPDEEPEVKRVRYFEIQSSSTEADNNGTDIFQVFRCKNANVPAS